LFAILITITLLGYAVGSFPAGYLAGRIAGVDVRTLGSGNVGATNVTRVLGKRYGYPVFLIDFSKGFVAVWAALIIGRANRASPAFLDLSAAIAAIAAVLGHSYSIWLRFHGGKGVATSLGALLAMDWMAALSVCAVWILVFQLTKYVSVASLAAAVALPVAMAILFFVHQLHTPIFVWFTLALGLLVIWRHRSNIVRLLNGTESRFNRK
jgi:glycerol-3-phosphate acyltransferase PlsY